MDEFEEELKRILAPAGSQSNYGPDSRVAPALRLLIQAVRSLDKTGSRLATIGLWLSGIVLVIGCVQVGLMLKGR
jgi:hypothetical protein